MKTAEDQIPEHLRPLPAEAVHALCDHISRELGPALDYTTRLELEAARETRTPHDMRRLAKALQHVAKRPDLADTVAFLVAKGNRE